MRRMTQTVIGVLAASLAVAGVANAQLTVDQPKSGNNEFVGAKSMVTIGVPAGLNGTGEVVSTENISIVVDFIDDMGTGLFPPFTFNTTTAYANVLVPVTIDLSTITGLSGVLANPAVTGVRFTATSATGTGLAAVLNLTNEALDEIAKADLTAPTLVNAFLNNTTPPNKLFLVFSESTNTGAAGNNANQTVLASIDATDIQFKSSNTFDGTEPNPIGLSAPAFVDAANTTISFTLAGTNDAALGNFFRPNFDNAVPPVAQNQFKDIVGNGAANTAVAITSLAAMDITGGTWIKAVPVNGGTVVGALRITFNNPVNPGVLGDATFYNGLKLAGMASDMAVVAVAVDPNDASSVLLDVASTGGDMDGVSADGLDTATLGPFSLAVDAATGTPPQDIFSQTFTGTDTQTIGDGINPSVVGGLNFVDTDSDGTQDGVRLFFDEPLAAGSSGAATLSASTMKVRNGITVHPVESVDTTTGVRTTATTVTAPGTTMADVIATSGVTLSSTDSDGNGTVTARETNNTLTFAYDPAGFDFDGDMNVGPADTDGEAWGGTDDAGLIDLTVDITMDAITDAGANPLTGAITNLVSNTDDAPPVFLAANFFTGDNSTGGAQKASEQDATVGDGATNNLVQCIFTEMVNAGGVVENNFRWGTGPTDRFNGGNSNGTFGAENNILQLTDGSGRGVAPGDALTIVAGNGLTGAGANAFPGNTVAVNITQRTGPYVPLQRDVNGATIASAFLVDTNNDGFANRIDMFFTAAPDASSVQDADFSVQGVNNSAITVTVSGSRVSINLPGSTVALSSNVTVTYNGATDTTPLSSGGNAIAKMNDTFTARQVPTPLVDGEFTATQDISGFASTDGVTPVDAGTKIFGFIAAPMAITIEGTMDNVTFSFNCSSTSTDAFMNWYFGFEDYLYLFNDEGDMFFGNTKGDFFSSGGARSITQIFVNRSNMTFTGKGSSQSQNSGSTSVSNGKITMGWAPLASSDGTAFQLFNSGVGDEPIASSTVIADDSGNFTLHMTAPRGAFTGGGFLDAEGWPIIIVIELPTGVRYAVSGLNNTINCAGPLTFASLQSGSSPGTAGNPFNINLANVGSDSLFAGWNTLNYSRQGGVATASNQLPVLPRDVESTEVTVGTSPSDATPLSQFVYVNDTNNDGMWTFADDGAAPFGGLIIDVNMITHVAFTMTSKGVQVGSSFNGNVTDGITSVIGGYATGFFSGTATRLLVFQFGAPITPGRIFTAADPFPNNSTTLGWALASNVPAGASDTTAAFFTANPGAVFLIEFDRTSSAAVNITTSNNGAGDNKSVGNQALFVNYGP